MTADATELPVLAGPAEATEIGNLLVQAMALGELASLEDARAVVRASFQTVVYEPHDGIAWREARQRFEQIVAVAPPPKAEVGA
jgi:sugar (pentulose or hexulose) kinase